MSNNKTDVPPLCRIGQLFLLFPTSIDGWKRKAVKFYAVLICLVLSSIYIALLMYKKQGKYKTQSVASSFVDGVCVTLVVLFVIVTIIRTYFVSQHNFKLFFELLFEVERLMKNENITGTSCPTFLTAFVLSSIYIIILFADSFYITERQITAQNLLTNTFMDILVYLTLMNVFIIFNCTMLIKTHFKNLNDYLETTSLLDVNLLGATLHFNNYVGKTMKVHEKAKHLRNIFTQLCVTVKIFNSIFDWGLCFVSAIDLMGIFKLVTSSVVVFQEYGVAGNVATEIHVVLNVIMWSLTLMMIGVVVATSCDATTMEARRTASICYTLLLNFPSASDNVEEGAVREELILLAQQSTHYSPQFSAAGLFYVDYRMLFGIIATATSYTIVLLQLTT